MSLARCGHSPERVQALFVLTEQLSLPSSYLYRAAISTEETLAGEGAIVGQLAGEDPT